MAQRRMFDKEFVTSCRFMSMTDTARLCYFMLGVIADDEGFVGNPQMVKASVKTLKYLVSEGYIYRFESGVVLIRHWNIHNKIRKDTFKKTLCTAEKALVFLNSENIYEYASVTEPIQSRNESVPQERIGKDREGQDRIDQDRIDQDRSGEESAGKSNSEKSVTAQSAGALSDIDPEKNFLLFWNCYPKKTNEEKARQTFMGLQEDFSEIMEGLEYNKKSNQWVSDHGFFVPDAHNWLNRKGWKDRPPLYKPKTEPIPAGAQAASGHLGAEELAAIRRVLSDP